MSDEQKSDAAGYGQQAPEDTAGPFNSQVFLVKQLMAQMATARPVIVTEVSGGGPSGPPTVSVQSMVSQVDGVGNATPRGVIYGVPVFRLQGGTNAIICDPKVGDKGIMVCADRDISAVKASGDIATPGSQRRYDPADGMYFGGILNGAALQYIEFTEDGINVHDKNGNIFALSAAGITLTILGGAGTMIVKGAIAATGGVTSNNGLHSMSSHVHSGVTTGLGNSGPPVNE